MCGEGFLCKGIELSGVRIALDGCVEPISLEGLVPHTETRQLSRVQSSLDAMLVERPRRRILRQATTPGEA